MHYLLSLVGAALVPYVVQWSLLVHLATPPSSRNPKASPSTTPPPPFTLLEEPCYFSSGGSSSSSSSSVSIKQVHLIVLVHGLMGNQLAMSVLQESLLVEISSQQHKQQPPNRNNHNAPHFVVYAAKSNVGNTYDGIAAGGRRVAEEINLLVDHIMDDVSLKASASAASQNNNLTLPQISFPWSGILWAVFTIVTLWRILNGNVVVFVQVWRVQRNHPFTTT
jgi:hypothetical protein